jgi:multidrug resistance efflux pump
MGDYRAALDTAYEALTQAKTENDILSFLYAQAEAHINLHESKQAKSLLKKVLSIDKNYRLAKEKLETLDEI